jgi:hypothetical protein
MSELQTLVTLNTYGRVVLRRVLHHLLRAGTSRAPGKGAVSECTVRRGRMDFGDFLGARSHCQEKCRLPNAASMNYTNADGCRYTTAFTSGSVRALHDRDE